VDRLGRPDLETLIVPHALHTLPIVQFDPVQIAIGTVRLQLRRRGEDADAVDARMALRILEELQRTEPELPASRWYASATEDQLRQFAREWEGHD
jgi:hypothetical protein